MNTMRDDVMERLARRNPVDEANLAGAGADPAARATRERILAEPVGSRALVRRPTTRRVAGLAGTAALGALGAALFTHLPGGGSSSERSAALPPGAWGIASTVRVTPFPGGMGLDEATARAAHIITARAAAMGWKDVSADVAGPGEVRVVVPWAELPWTAGALTYSANLAVYDLATSVVGDSRNASLALSALRNGVPDDRWYLFTRGRSGLSIFTGPVTRADLSRIPRGWTAVRAARGRHVFMVDRFSLPGVGASAGLDPRRWVVMSDPPAIGPDGIRSVTADGGRARVTVDDVAVSRPLLVSRGSVFALGSGDLSAGALTLRPRSSSAPAPFRRLAGGGLGASMSVTASRAVGTTPARRGVRVTRPVFARDPGAMWAVVYDDGTPPFGTPRPGTFLRVFATRTPGGVWQIVEALTTTGHRQAWLRAPGHTRRAYDCALQPDARIIIGCDRTGAEAWGRVAPAVASVEVRYRNGAVRSGIVENGWFLVITARGRGGVIVARDAAGRDLGRTPR